MDENKNLKSEQDTNLKENKKLYRYATGTKKHKIYFPFTLIILGIYFIYLIIVITSTTELIPIIPGSAITDLFVLLIMLPLIGIILLFFTPLLAYGYFKLYRLIFGESKLYFLDMRVQLGKWRSKDIARRAFTPGLIVCAFAQVAVNSTGVAAWVPEIFSNNMILALYNSAFYVFPIIVILLAPLWLLYDAGVMSKTNPEKMIEKRTPETIVTVDRFFLNKFKGFGGIAFIANFFVMIIQTILLTISPIMLLFVLILPFIGIALMIPTQALYEKMLPWLTRRIHMRTMLHNSELTKITIEQCPACNVKLGRSLM